jgi:hypothetical protein
MGETGKVAKTTFTIVGRSNKGKKKKAFKARVEASTCTDVPSNVLDGQHRTGSMN